MTMVMNSDDDYWDDANEEEMIMVMLMIMMTMMKREEVSECEVEVSQEKQEPRTSDVGNQHRACKWNIQKKTKTSSKKDAD